MSTKTGTLCPLLNAREYTPNERIVLEHFFTNTDKNIYCATNNLSSQLWAFLVGQYSRTHKSLRDRFLQLFVDSKKALDKGDIAADEYISIDDLAIIITDNKAAKLDFFETKAAGFLEKWGVKYGHNSLKDADNIRFAIEGISQLATKYIESPFPALGNFQEKSTRYIPFNGENILFPEEFQGTENGKKLQELNKRSLALYEKYLPQVKQLIIEKGIIKKEDCPNEAVFQGTVNSKAFDTCRYLLPNTMSTSLGASYSTRTLEGHLTFMLSHPLKELNMIAREMHQEGLKLSPGLLRHVDVNPYEQSYRQKISQNIDKYLEEKETEVYRGIENEDRVQIVQTDDLDEMVVASFLYNNDQQNFNSFADILGQVREFSVAQKEEIMELTLGNRCDYDRVPREGQHGTVLVDFLVDFGAYRDIQRHRASYQLWPGATAVLGYDYPELIDYPELADFKNDYDELMLEITYFNNEMVKLNAQAAGYTASFAHLIRCTAEMNPGQLAYVLELRTTPWGHQSYRRLFQQLYKLMKDVAPIFCKYIRVDEAEEASRLKEESKKC